ncbi:MAG: hypothetical protein J6P16_03400 [Eubacterium sp.]|nr:hypothetical protein [Eubacterium sp.]
MRQEQKNFQRNGLWYFYRRALSDIVHSIRKDIINEPADELAGRSEIAYSTLWSLENRSTSSDIMLSTIIRFCESVGIMPSDLFFMTEQRLEQNPVKTDPYTDRTLIYYSMLNPDKLHTAAPSFFILMGAMIKLRLILATKEPKNMTAEDIQEIIHELKKNLT